MNTHLKKKTKNTNSIGWILVFTVVFAIFYVIGSRQPDYYTLPMRNLHNIIFLHIPYFLSRVLGAPRIGLVNAIYPLSVSTIFLIMSVVIYTADERNNTLTVDDWVDIIEMRVKQLFSSLFFWAIYCNNMINGYMYINHKSYQITFYIVFALYVWYILRQMKSKSKSWSRFLRYQIVAIGFCISIAGYTRVLHVNGIVAQSVFPKWIIEQIVNGFGKIQSGVLCLVVLFLTAILLCLITVFLLRRDFVQYKNLMPILHIPLYVSVVIYSLLIVQNNDNSPASIKYWVFLLGMIVFFIVAFYRRFPIIPFVVSRIVLYTFTYASVYALIRFFDIFEHSYEKLLETLPEISDKILLSIWQLPVFAKIEDSAIFLIYILLIVLFISAIPLLVGFVSMTRNAAKNKSVVPVEFLPKGKQKEIKKTKKDYNDPIISCIMYVLILFGALLRAFDFPVKMISVAAYVMIFIGFFGFVLLLAACVFAKEYKGVCMHLFYILFLVISVPCYVMIAPLIKYLIIAVIAAQTAGTFIMGAIDGSFATREASEGESRRAFSDTINAIDNAVASGAISKYEGISYAHDVIDIAMSSGLFSK